ncbi:MobA/MobL family protein [Halomonas sp. JS92-SW72]|uniref:MobA/MobL family protein n=1 Tax=Halomonas sp. JS92-SW72 TaxID=2306583 RepID=UPI000E5BB145|nr:MobA/MobL family protein [Halomonas sp. JS92-SW72]AXY44069.1 hypothetical protein D1793_18905 [Halomonas sp. JS92-SW72]
MAVYHLRVKPIQRSKKRHATAAAAYRAGVCIVDERTGKKHDYRHKMGVLGAELCLPGGGTEERAAFWNRVEHHHRRKDAVVAREIEVSLPRELNDGQRWELAMTYAHELAGRYGVAVDAAFHAPRPVSDKDLELNPEQFHMIDPDTGHRHNGNWHCHLLFSACHVEPDGTLGKKCVELDPIHCRRRKILNLTQRERSRWAELQNRALERAGAACRVDHRSYVDRGNDRVPTVHLGGYAARMRRDGTPQLSEQAMLNREIVATNNEVWRLREQARRERIEERELKAWIKQPGVCSASGRIILESRMMDSIERSYLLSQQIEEEERSSVRQSRADFQHSQVTDEQIELTGSRPATEEPESASEMRSGEYPAPTPARLTGSVPEPPRDAQVRAKLAVRRLLCMVEQIDRAAAIREAMLDPDDRFAEVFQEQLLEVGIGAHGELSHGARPSQGDELGESADGTSAEHPGLTRADGAPVKR